MNYTTYTTDTDKKDFDKSLKKIATNMFDYLFTIDNNGKKEIATHASGDISKKILMTKDTKGFLNETRLNKLCAILNSILEDKKVNYRVSTPCIDNLKIGDNIAFKFVDTKGKEKKISVKEIVKKSVEKTENKTTSNTSNTSNISSKPTEKVENKKEVQEIMNEKNVTQYLDTLKDYSFIIKFLEKKGYSVTKK